MYLVFFFKQKTAYEMRISDWSSDVCSSDLVLRQAQHERGRGVQRQKRRWPDRANPPGHQREVTYFSSAPFSAVIFLPFAAASAATAFGDTISPLAFR